MVWGGGGVGVHTIYIDPFFHRLVTDKKTETKAVLGLSHGKGQKKQTQTVNYS